ncbi:AAA family ATPase [Actinopolymorpha pittospori]|uniref:AAA family ATPase n=1 Tax=Actinopolymorpha pittospori TaxID=648752 RepID=UPI001789C175
MRIQTVRICNFRCLQDVTISFDGVTTFIGPNGAGKSSVLRALEWFFNGDTTALTDHDVYSGADPAARQITVEVTFTELTERDRTQLGERYAPVGFSSFRAKRTWEAGVDRMTVATQTYAPFEEVRRGTTVAEKKSTYSELVASYPMLNLPKWTKVDEAEQAMKAWEKEHPDQLEEVMVSTAQIFGFNGQNKLSGIFDYVLVAADMRAVEESVEGKKTIIGRILDRTVSRDVARAEFEALAAEVSQRQAEITRRLLGGQLEELGQALTAEVAVFTSGRGVRLNVTSPDVRPIPASVNVLITDALVETSVDRQGHGFQRALLISSLKLLATRGTDTSDSSVILLAVEEPELFQHPTQARVFARVLRELSEAPDRGMQIAYATHSPYFVDPRYFDQVRRVTRSRHDVNGHAEVEVFQASLEAVCARLDGFVPDNSIRSRWDQVCTRTLAEALFAEAVVLVEGDCDKGILDGMASRGGQISFETHGITVAQAAGKQNLLTPHAILAELRIPTLTVFDSDKGSGDRKRASGKDPLAARREDENNASMNRLLLRYFSVPESDYPAGKISPTLYAWDGDLERVLARDWPGWEDTHKQLIDEGRGVNGKDPATYGLAAKECPEGPTGVLLDVVAAAGNLVAR